MPDWSQSIILIPELSVQLGCMLSVDITQAVVGKG